MPFHTRLTRGANKFFGGAGKAIRKFGRKIESDLNTTINFAERKLLPTIENVAGSVAKYAPLAMVLAPEFAPAIGAIGAGALVAKGGARAGRQLIGTGRKVVGAIRAGDASTAIREAQTLRRQGETAYQRGAEGVENIQMMIKKPQKNPLKG